MSRVLLAGLSKKNNERLQKIFSKVGTPCEVTPSVEAAIERVPANPPALVVVNFDGRLEPIHGIHEVLKTSAPVTALVAIIPQHHMETAVRIMRAGAYDCLSTPLDEFDVLAVSKRAAFQKGRALFVAQVERPKRKWAPVSLILAAVLTTGMIMNGIVNGPPPDEVSLASAHLTGLQWEKRLLWVGDWFDSNILCYKVKSGIGKKYRKLEASALYKMADGQPMLLCNTPNMLVTIGTDLKLRSHQRMVGLPTVQTESVPGSRPTGLVWDGSHLWSCDADDNTLYRFSEDFKVIETVKSLLRNPVGMAFENKSIWVLGGTPLQLARLEKVSYGYVWRGPYEIKNLLMEGVTPSGLAIGFGRIWLVSGGYPMMVSGSLAEITGQVFRWKDKTAASGVS